MRVAIVACVLAVTLVPGSPGLQTTATSAPAAAAGQRTTETRHYTQQDQQTKRYVYVPVNVPAGTTSLTVSYEYDRAGGANTVDLGLYEPGPLTLGTPAFRGYSGGAQDTVTVAVDHASPGYWPGPLPPGEWHVLLGLYQVGPGGVDVTVTSTTSSAPAAGPTPAVQPRNPGPIRRGAAWYAGAMHTHTTFSDGVLSPADLVDKARAEKLDFVVVTDHNNTAHQLVPLDRPGLLVISGEEVTTPGGHFNVWGLSGARAYVDFRIASGDPALPAVMKSASDRGALISINHAVTDCVACSWTHAVPDSVNAWEVFNGTVDGRRQAVAMWDQLLRAGRRVTAVGESDWHRGDAPIGSPTSRVWAPELSASAILAGVKSGRVIVMANTALPTPDIVARAGGATARVGDELTVAAGEGVSIDVTVDADAYRGNRIDLVWRGERVAHADVPEDGTVRFVRYPTAPGYFRVQIAGPDGSLRAFANPIFVRVR
ncbi:MAG TPA: CehA/McbA family metallohydrolase [Vicinamibacterales bacterium]|nr:CehA/McbA family metallohydrolase [Vicinamibacterales bacterium]